MFFVSISSCAKYFNVVDFLRVVLFVFSAKTKNVDQTISNLLDGSIHYKPLNDDEQAREKEEIESIVQENNKKVRATIGLKE